MTDDYSQLPCTILRIKIPEGTTINILNLLEVTSPSGICLIVKIPLFEGRGKHALGVDNIVNAIKDAGGTIEFEQY